MRLATVLVGTLLAIVLTVGSVSVNYAHADDSMVAEDDGGGE